MAVFEIFSHPEIRRYKTHIFSKATFLQIFLIALTFIPPLIIAYKTQGFWKKIDNYREQGDVRFKHEVLLLVYLDDDQFLTWSTYNNYNSLYINQLRIPIVKSQETDEFYSGKKDETRLIVEFPLQNDENVKGIDMLVIFEYKLYTYQRLTMESMAHVSHFSPFTGSELRTVGDLKFKQRFPIGYKGSNNVYNTSIINSTSLLSESYDLSTIFQNYAKRNFSTTFGDEYAVWKKGKPINDRFIIDATIKYPEETILFRPGFWQMIKWGWVQYLSLLLIFLFVFDRVKVFVFCNQLVSTIVDRPIHKKIS